MNNTATRLITLIFLLQNQPNQKASELAEKLGVSLRTVHRYFDMLEEMGIPLYAERGPYGGFSLVRGYKMPPLVFTLEEAVALVLGTGMVEEMWGELYRESARGALAKLENLLPDEQVREVAWARGSLVATGMNRSDLKVLTPTLEKLRRAIREHRSREHELPKQSTAPPHPARTRPVCARPSLGLVVRRSGSASFGVKSAPFGWTASRRSFVRRHVQCPSRFRSASPS